MVRRQRGASAALAVNLAYKYGIPFVKKYGKQVLPLVLKRHGLQRGCVFRGKNRQRGRKNKKQKGGLKNPLFELFRAGTRNVPSLLY